MRRAVVITGLGVVSPLGLGAGALWEGLCAGRSGVGPLTLLDRDAFPCRLAGEVRDAAGSASGFSAKDFVPKGYRKAIKVMARDIELAVAAAKFAVDDAKLVTRGTLAEGSEATTTYASERMGCQIGAGLIPADSAELAEAFATAVDSGDRFAGSGGFSLAKWGGAEGGGGGMNNLTPLWMLKYLPNMLACHVTIVHGAEGPSNTILAGEASGLLCVGESMRVIARGAADLCFSGGAESKLNHLGMARLVLNGRAAKTGEASSGAEVAMAYDPASPGGIPGEGGGIIVLEEATAARARGANPIARVLGFGAAHAGAAATPWSAREFAHHGLASAIRAALRDADAQPEEIDAIVPQASGFPLLDQAEATALADALGPRAKDVPAITLTPNLGELWAGHGAIQVAAGALALREETIPPALHAGTPRGINAKRSGVARRNMRRILVCSSGMGGQAAALVLGTMA